MGRGLVISSDVLHTEECGLPNARSRLFMKGVSKELMQTRSQRSALATPRPILPMRSLLEIVSKAGRFDGDYGELCPNQVMNLHMWLSRIKGHADSGRCFQVPAISHLGRSMSI